MSKKLFSYKTACQFHHLHIELEQMRRENKKDEEMLNFLTNNLKIPADEAQSMIDIYIYGEDY